MDSVLVIRLVLIIADELEDGVFKGRRTASRGTCRGSARMELGVSGVNLEERSVKFGLQVIGLIELQAH
jgi:hypothetical protein